MPGDEDFFAPPPFRPDEALQRLRRDLRELGLSEREGVFERRGVAVARAQVNDGVIAAARVRRPSRASPEWLPSRLDSAAALRDFVAALKKALQQWEHQDD
ncbi:MAG: hypothetical protein J0M00_15020 [Burkholderiales bacterium]|jgi:branched-subunit amino acid aminotransferase/4-amino-4-deoxychorismate lyase|nr:hypothetical protein [Burkholderiales bacterium]